MRRRSCACHCGRRSGRARSRSWATSRPPRTTARRCPRPTWTRPSSRRCRRSGRWTFTRPNGSTCGWGRRCGRSTATGRTVDVGHDHVPYDTLVLATGSLSRRPPITGIEHPRVFTLRTADDAAVLRGRVRDAQRVAIIGAGFIGLEVASSLRKAGRDVVVLEMANRVLSRVTSPPVSAFFEALHRGHGVDLRTGVSVSQIEADGGQLSLEADDAVVCRADVVVIGAGARPNDDLARLAGLEVNNGILVDDRNRTSDPAVFAMGDCCNQFHATYQTRLRLESVQNATDQAKAVAAAICSSPPADPDAAVVLVRPVRRQAADRRHRHRVRPVRHPRQPRAGLGVLGVVPQARPPDRRRRGERAPRVRGRQQADRPHGTARPRCFGRRRPRPQRPPLNRDQPAMDAQRDPFTKQRQDTGIERMRAEGQDMPLILRLQDVRKTCKDWKTFSNDDPFMIVPHSEADVRTVRQVPDRDRPAGPHRVPRAGRAVLQPAQRSRVPGRHADAGGRDADRRRGCRIGRGGARVLAAAPVAVADQAVERGRVRGRPVDQLGHPRVQGRGRRDQRGRPGQLHPPEVRGDGRVRRGRLLQRPQPGRLPRPQANAGGEARVRQHGLRRRPRHRHPHRLQRDRLLRRAPRGGWIFCGKTRPAS